MEENKVSKLDNISNEVIVVGSIFKKPDLLMDFGDTVRSKYDFVGEDTKFFYDMAELMYNTYSQELDEAKVNAFMMQDNDRLSQYKRYGKYQWITKAKKISNVDDFDKSYDTLKKYSLCREYERKGHNEIIYRIVAHERFPEWSATKIIDLVSSNIDKVSTVILANQGSRVLSEGAVSKLQEYLIAPQMGILTPWDIINNAFRGLQLGQALFNGFLSNEGKTRNLMLLLAHVALVHNEKVLIMSNEMGEQKMFSCLLTTVINNPQFQALHGIEIRKTENEIVLGIWHDDNGNVIERGVDDFGAYIESEEAYIRRVENTSEEYRYVLKVSNWLENKKGNLIYFKDMGKDYSDKTVTSEIKRHNKLFGVKYFGYDTLKGYGNDEWSVVKQTATRIQETCKELNVFTWAVFQLTDDTVFTDIFNLSSNNIANAKQIKHVADFLILGKRIKKNEYKQYEYIADIDPDWGDTVKKSLNGKKQYFAMKVDKNRNGKKPVILFEYNLDLNTWIEVGELTKKE